MSSITRGAIGEMLAARFLRDKGYDILTANTQSRFGEIDIIVADNVYIAFVEVKLRSDDYMYSPKEAVTHDKQKKIIKTAMMYIKNNEIDLQPRFDVIEIVVKKNKPTEVVEIDHIMNAFEAGDLSMAF